MPESSTATIDKNPPKQADTSASATPRSEIESIDDLRPITRKKLLSVVDSHSFHPNMERKTRDERIADNLRWYKEYGFVNLCYNEYGLDIKDFRNQDDYIERYVVKRDRNTTHHGGVDPARHKGMIIDKINFYSYLEKMLPGYTPTVRVIFSASTLYYPMLEHDTAEAAIEGLANGKYACKLSRGTMGADFFLFEKDEEGFLMDGKRVGVKEITGRTTAGRRYLIQDFVYQHKDIAKIAPNSLNTIRVETVRWKKNTHIHYALARFSARAEANVDNATQGGTFVGIDIDRGVLREFGEYFKFENGAHETEHPISGVTYKDFPLPYWDEIVELVTKLHPLFYGLVSVGWDIAITENGPIVLEGNTSPCSKMAQMANGGLKQRWNGWKKTL